MREYFYGFHIVPVTWWRLALHKLTNFPNNYDTWRLFVCSIWIHTQLQKHNGNRRIGFTSKPGVQQVHVLSHIDIPSLHICTQTFQISLSEISPSISLSPQHTTVHPYFSTTAIALMEIDSMHCIGWSYCLQSAKRITDNRPTISYSQSISPTMLRNTRNCHRHASVHAYAAIL